MENNFGFIHDKIDIKILILFVLRRVAEPVDTDELMGLMMLDEGVTYFDLMECLAELEQTEHVFTDGVRYRVTEKGKRNGEITERSLPYTVRLAAERAVSSLRAQQRRSALIETTHTLKRGGGYNVALSLSDETGKILDMTVFVPDEQQAVKMENNFRQRAEAVYGDIAELLLRD